MKKYFLLLFLFSLSSFAQDVWVNGYARKDGTVVQPHYRTSADKTVNNNFTTIDNVNPYTGKDGTLPRDYVYPTQPPVTSALPPITIPVKQNNVSPTTHKVTVTTGLSGAYKVPLIEEQIYKDKKWVTVKKEQSVNYLFFGNDLVYFKRGQNKWLGRNQIFKNFNSEANVYIYNSDYGLILLDGYLRFILFYDPDNTKRYLYVIGDSAPSVVPTD